MNKIILLICLFLWTLSAKSEDQPSKISVAKHDFFPLEVGNNWSYTCSVEGEKAFEKEIKVIKPVDISGKPGYQASYVVNGVAADIYFWEDDSHMIHRTYNRAGDIDEIVISRFAKIGDVLGELKITREALQKTLATGEIKTLVAENFDAESSGLSGDRRNEWRGQFFADGIGLVVEADGLGGDCVLKSYSLNNHP
ncbi:hypothetical protein IVG45_21445 [Methylomonas sp. LL1]|uniref:hypothetical protein n=1 Tax=Methylomonas sp. LL1 TaxID=2785785 RepID=UPI0018C3D530|nr:hypothetical protein [Methylomonas sp. LL1]QPK63333.1 hypothetical protein IVG45_21445 [Methylomonas sp. LL1]